MQKVRQKFNNHLTALRILFQDLFHLPTKVTFQLSLTVLCALLDHENLKDLKSGLFFFAHNYRIMCYFTSSKN